VRGDRLESRNEPLWKPVPSDRSFQSDDGRFGLTIGRSELKKILRYSLAAGRLETGGILVGHYSQHHDVAFVGDVSGPPRDSKSGVTWFHRGIQGLQTWLNGLWSKDSYYLGEWHFHPGGRPAASGIDLRQIKEISEAPAYLCPEPLLIIVGGTMPASWEVAAYVSPRNCSLVELKQMDGSRTEVGRSAPIRPGSKVSSLPARTEKQKTGP